jgi:hypothetical protein
LRDNVILEPNDPAILKQRSVRGAAATFIGQGLRFVLQLASQVILARAPGTSSLLHFGSHMTGYNLVNFFGTNLDSVLDRQAWREYFAGLI